MQPHDRTTLENPHSPADLPLVDFSALYDLSDPRAYYQALSKLDYQTPSHVQRLARWCLRQHPKSKGAQPGWVMDIGCGYATNAAGLAYGLDTDILYARYNSPAMEDLSPEDIKQRDLDFLECRKDSSVSVAGLDISKNALDYAHGSTLLQECYNQDLLENEPSQDLIARLNTCALIIESGVPIFIVPGVLDRLLGHATTPNRPWIITAPTRYANKQLYEDALHKHDYVLEDVLGAPIPHRRFNSAEEQKNVIADQQVLGLDCEREKKEGYVFANLLLARPKSDSTPLNIDYKV